MGLPLLRAHSAQSRLWPASAVPEEAQDDRPPPPSPHQMETRSVSGNVRDRNVGGDIHVQVLTLV